MHILATDDEQSALNILVGAIKEVVPQAEVHGFRNPLEAIELMKEWFYVNSWSRAKIE